jgi:tetraacyldisaccharide 4'-kinase
MTGCARPWLLPLVPLYAACAAAASALKRSHRLQWPVVSIGNLSTGGTGKTPLTMEIARLLEGAGVAVDVLSRGYGRRSRGAVRVDPDGRAEEFGDEPLLLAQQTGVPVYVARQRYEAGLLAEAECGTGLEPGRRVHLLDDGMQHRQLCRNVEIVLLNRQDWGDCLLPAGNLREPRSSIRRADAVMVPAEDQDFLQNELRQSGFNGAIWPFRRRMILDRACLGRRAGAFCGITRPSAFFDGLEEAGAAIAARFAFPDHHRFRAAELRRIAEEAAAAGAEILLCTGKDLARLGTMRSILEERFTLHAVELQCEILGAEEFLQWLMKRLDGVEGRRV